MKMRITFFLAAAVATLAFYAQPERAMAICPGYYDIDYGWVCTGPDLSASCSISVDHNPSTEGESGTLYWSTQYASWLQIYNSSSGQYWYLNVASDPTDSMGLALYTPGYSGMPYDSNGYSGNGCYVQVDIASPPPPSAPPPAQSGSCSTGETCGYGNDTNAQNVATAMNQQCSNVSCYPYDDYWGSCVVCDPVSPPQCASNYGQSCSASSACGTNYGTYDCSGNCNASAPAVPSNYGQSCSATSAQNACSMTNTNYGTYQCNGQCSASTPSAPADSMCSAPTASISLNPSPIGGAGTSYPFTVSWSSTNASSCVVYYRYYNGAYTDSSPGWQSEFNGTSGSRSDVDVILPAQYRLVCSGPGGTAYAYATQTAYAPPTASLTLTPTPVGWGAVDSLHSDRFQVVWSSSNASSCSVSYRYYGGAYTDASPTWNTEFSGTSGNQADADSSLPAQYRLLCTGPGGSVTQYATQTRSNRAPNAPTFTALYDDATNQPVGSWSAPGNHAAGYRIYMSATDPDSDNIQVYYQLYDAQTGTYSPVQGSTAYPAANSTSGGTWLASGGYAYVDWLQNAQPGNYYIRAYAYDGSSSDTYAASATSAWTSWQQITLTTPSIAGSCSANASSVYQGQSVTWTTSGISGGNGTYAYSWNGTDGLTGTGSSVSHQYNTSGSQTASVTVSSSGAADTTLNCAVPGGGGGGTTLAVNSCAPSLTANPTTIDLGQSSTLQWSEPAVCSNSCVFSDGHPATPSTSGTYVVTPTDSPANYQITCTPLTAGPSPYIAQTSIAVRVPTATIAAAPARVKNGASTTISWSGANVNSCSVTRNGVAWKSSTADASRNVSDSAQDTITAQTKYVVTCVNNGGPGASAQANVIVNLIPETVEF